MEVDRIQQKLGGCGVYQALVYTLLSVVYMRGAWQTFGSMFLAAIPDYSCIAPGNQTNINGTDYVPKGECYVYAVISNGSDVSNETHCQHWTYDTSVYTSTIVSEWDLVCSKDYLMELSTTVYMIGSSIGAITLPLMSDRYGRKPVMIACLLVQAAVGLGTAAVENYIVFVALRWLIGILNMGIGLSAYVSMTEVFSASHRTLPSIAIQIFWAIGVMSLALFGYLVRNWRHLQILISLPNVFAVAYIWCLPESLPWLLSKKEVGKAKQVIKLAARLNRLAVSPDDLLQQTETAPSIATGLVQVEDQTDHHRVVDDGQCLNPQTVPNGVCEKKSASRSEPGILDILKSPRLRLYALLMWYLFFANSLSYYGISFNIPNLHGNPFFNLFLMGAVEVPAHVICMLVINWSGRRRPVCVFLFICGITSIAALFIPDTTGAGGDLSPLKLTLIMIAKFGITGSYSTIYLLATEIFPTAVRNRCLGMASFFENIGAILAPPILFAARTLPQLPLAVFGVLATIGGIAVLFLPETRNRPLPETVEEIENWT